MSKEFKMRTKERYSFKELEELHRHYLLNSESCYDYKSSKGNARLNVLSKPYEKSYQNDRELLEKAYKDAQKRFDVSRYADDYLIGYNIALEEESLDKDIINKTHNQIDTLRSKLNLMSLTFTTLLTTIISLIALLLTEYFEWGKWAGLTLILAVGIFSFSVLRPRIFKAGIKDGATFEGKLSKKSENLIKSGILLGSSAIGVALSIFSMNLLNYDILALLEMIPLLLIVFGSYILFYIISFFTNSNRKIMALLALVLSMVLAFLI